MIDRRAMPANIVYRVLKSSEGSRKDVLLPHSEPTAFDHETPEDSPPNDSPKNMTNLDIISALDAFKTSVVSNRAGAAYRIRFALVWIRVALVFACLLNLHFKRNALSSCLLLLVSFLLKESSNIPRFGCPSGFKIFQIVFCLTLFALLSFNFQRKTLGY